MLNIQSMHGRCRHPAVAETNPSYPVTFAEDESMGHATIYVVKTRYLILFPPRLKCDRGMPCDACARRGLALSCTYPASTPLQSGKRLINPSSTAMHNKIANLEKLVLSMKSQNGYPTENGQVSELNNLTDLHKSFGRIGLENTETNYVEGSHWTAILDGIAELKDYFDDDPETPEEDKEDERPSGPGPALLLGNYQKLDRQQILSTIPPKHEVDRLVSTFFNTPNMYLLALHGPTFLEEYDRFWKYPQKTSTMWVGLLFGIMCLACIYQKSINSAMNMPGLMEYNWQTQRRIELYRERVIQCLTLADYTKCGPYTLETLIYYLSIEYTSITDNQTGVWVLLGIVVRIAIRMGYHRDGSHSPRLSPFQTEMRRRIWAVIYLLDSGAADQYGLPRMINQSLSDTKEPLNLIDEDIGPDMEQLRQPRPDSEPTMIGFLAIKNRLIATQNTITDLTSYPNKAVSYKQIMKLDGIIQEQFQSIPPALRMRPLSKSLSDSTDVIANRLFLTLISYASRCLLHRDYLMAAHSDDRYEYSRKACISAALEILRIQEHVREECQIGRRLYQEQWKFQSSIKHVFFLAMTILCVYLNRHLGEGPGKSRIGDESLAKIIQALSTCYEIWSESSDASREAKKAAEMLRLVLGKTQKPGRLNQTTRAAVAMNHEPSADAIDPSLLTPDQSTPDQTLWGNYELESPCDMTHLDPMNTGGADDLNIGDWSLDSLTSDKSFMDNVVGSDWWAQFDAPSRNQSFY
ncbi:hypothetical protein UA08_06418 [Talaromyces atroroseus]|uniref:Xylanolytic transcriptional activator regulatory domain-containing protein n=1 Tax=Talaromyces atroroseus TaxID=1441469 RepID=A0A225AI55_TALAT|nr:hypothetical protein UA08_06418 [Talaromyces atroroseus]OKL57904.1 hypothetical protein UA08_06418 [Talaromyces atroroseus]